MKKELTNKELDTFELKNVIGGTGEKKQPSFGTNDRYCRKCGHHTPSYRDPQGKLHCSNCGGYV